MIRIIKPVLCATVAAAMTVVGGAYGIADIRAEIDNARSKQAQAHQIAEYVRSFGEDDANPAIQFAKEKWKEQADTLDKLYDRLPKGTYLGKFRITHYCPYSCCNGGYSRTASGTPLIPWNIVSVDPSVIALGSTVYVDGYGKFKACDTGGAIKGNRIDVCVASHAEAMRLGVVYKDVWVE